MKKDKLRKYSGNIMTYLNDATKENIAENEHYTVEMISAYDIIPNNRNFYGIRDIESLAAKMALSGHVSPLEVVKREDGKYTLISGERRRSAVLLRFETGEIKSPEVPCFVRKNFAKNDKLTAEQVEMINIICSNSYRTKTPFEELDEVLQLEPIARIFYEEERKQHEWGDGGTGIDFREFFAKNFLGIPPSTLQRTLALKNLVSEAREVCSKVNIPKTTLAELAYKKEEIQREILKQISNGELRGTVQEVKGFVMKNDEMSDEAKGDTEEKETVTENNKLSEIAEKTSDNEDNFEENSEETLEENQEELSEDNLENGDKKEDNGDGENEKSDRQEEISSDDVGEENQEENFADNSEKKPLAEKENTKSNGEKTKTVKNISSPKQNMKTPDEAREEAELWVQEGIKRMIKEAEEKKLSAEESGDTKNAAMWDLRRAAANLVLETIK